MDRGNYARYATVARHLTGLVIILIVFGMILNGTGLVAPELSQSRRAVQAITMLPMLCYLGAIWTIRRAFSALSKGRAVEKVVARLLVRMGALLFVGGLLRVFAEPLLTRLVLQRPWPVANFDIAAITLGTVGLLLFLLSRPLLHAAEMRTELDEFM